MVAFDLGVATVSKDELRGGFAGLFLAAAVDIGPWMDKMGLLTTGDVARTVVETQGPGTWLVRVRSETVNALAVPEMAAYMAPWWAERAQVRRLARVLAESAEATLPFWVAPATRQLLVCRSASDAAEDPAPEYASDPPGWVARFVVWPALQHHLQALPHISAAGEAAALKFADEVIGVAVDDRLRYRVEVPLSGIHLDAPDVQFAVGNTAIRSFSDAERGQWLDERGGPPILDRGDLTFPACVAEFAESSPRDAAYEPDPGPAPVLVGAFQLHGYWVAGRSYRVRSDPLWLQPEHQLIPLAVPGIVKEKSALSAEGFNAVTSTAELLREYELTQPRSPQDLALRRFFAGLARQAPGDFLPGGTDRSAADAMLDFTVALEALLLPYDIHARDSNLAARFRDHGTCFLAAGSSQRAVIRERLGRIYKVRSRLVHGDGGKHRTYPGPDEISRARDDARELAQRGLLRAVHEGFPTAEAFNQMVTGL